MKRERSGVVSVQQKYKLPLDEVRWVRLEAADRGVYPAEVVLEAIRKLRAQRSRRSSADSLAHDPNDN